MERDISKSFSELYSLALTLGDVEGFYDYLKINNLRMVDVFTKDKSLLRLPVVDLKTKERGVAPVFFGDIFFPKLRNEVFGSIQTLNAMSGIRFLDKGMPERVITKESQAKRFKRYYKPDRISTLIEDDVDRVARYIASNNERWNARGSKNVILPLETQKAWVSFAKEHSDSVFEEFVFEQEHGLPIHALVETQEDDDYLHWVNTYVTQAQDKEFLEERVGNNILYHLMLRALAKGKAFNLGIDTFEYKKLWSDEVRYVRGFTF
jgi:hypothetical protein